MLATFSQAVLVAVVGSQVFTRLATFGLNQIVTKALSVEAYGVGPMLPYYCLHSPRMCRSSAENDGVPERSNTAFWRWQYPPESLYYLVESLCLVQLLSIRFHLINTSILTLSREGLRRGCLRSQQVLSFCPRAGEKRINHHMITMRLMSRVGNKLTADMPRPFPSFI